MTDRGGRVGGRRSRRVPVAAAAAVGAWVVSAVWIVPALIRSAYAGESLPLLNGVISGQDVHPVDFYVDAWWRLALTASATAALLAATAGLYVRHSEPIRRFLGPHLGDWVGPEAPRAGPGGLLWVACAMGLAVGLSEWLLVEGRRVLFHLNVEGYSAEAYWMTPLAVTVVFVAAAVPFAALAAGVRRSGFLRLLVFVLVTAGVWSLATLAASFLHARIIPAARWLLGLGVASRVAPALSRRPSAIVVAARRTVVAVVALLTLTGGARLGWGALAEGRAIDALPAGAGVQNVLVLILDTVRAASTSLYGNARETTPNLDRWAAQSTVFERVIAPAPWTLPSHASVFTGGLHRVRSWLSPLEWEQPTLASALRERGYVPAGFVGNLYYLSRFFRIDRGFIHYEDYPVSMPMVVESSVLSREIRGRVEAWWEVAPHRHPAKSAQDVNEAFLEWLDAREDSHPFFAFLNYVDAHDPYTPPEPYWHRYLREGGMTVLGSWGRSYTERNVEDLRDAYEGAVSYVDARLDRLLEELDRRGALENTLVVIASDHGEEFLEHDVVGHAHSVYVPALHVPLLMRLPGRVPAGLRVPGTVGLVDVPATVWGVLFPDEPSPFDGEDLSSRWAAEPNGPGHPAASYYSEVIPRRGVELPDRYPTSVGSLGSIVRGGWHYIRAADGGEELYDIDSDPWEEVDLAGRSERMPVLEELRAALDSAGGTVRAGR